MCIHIPSNISIIEISFQFVVFIDITTQIIHKNRIPTMNTISIPHYFVHTSVVTAVNIQM